MTEKQKEMTIDELMALPKRKFLKRCKDWMKEFNGGKMLKINNISECPVALYVAHNDLKCNQQMVANTETCFMCGSPMCPDCMNHNVEIISRVTGYLSTVSGWNESKKQEFSDRNRHQL